VSINVQESNDTKDWTSFIVSNTLAPYRAQWWRSVKGAFPLLPQEVENHAEKLFKRSLRHVALWEYRVGLAAAADGYQGGEGLHEYDTLPETGGKEPLQHQ